MQSLDNGRLSVGAAATAQARRFLDTAIRYANERKAVRQSRSRSSS
jgi:acyl-CoA dehydrogenase